MRLALLASLAVVLAGCADRPSPTEPPLATVADAVGSVEVADPAPLAFPTFHVREWTLDDGLPGPIAAVAQTPDGFLWVATAQGLFRFDGVRFTAFTTETTPVFRADNFVGLYAARNGDLWVGVREPWSYRLRDGVWTAFDARPVVGQDWVQGFAEDVDGGLWISGTGDRVGRFDGAGWQPVRQRTRDVWTPFVADGQGAVWTYLPPADAPGEPVATLKDGVVARWDGARFVPGGPAGNVGFEASTHGPLFHVPDGRRVDVTDADGERLGWFWQDETALAARLVDRRGRLWLEPTTSEAEGVLIVVRDGVEIARFEPEGALYIDQVFEDRQGVVWAVSPSIGLLQISESAFATFGEAEGAPLPSHRAADGADGSVIVSGGRGPRAGTALTVRGDALSTQRYPIAATPGTPPRMVGNPDAQVGMIAEDGAGRRFGLYQRGVFRLTEGRAEILPALVPERGWWEGSFPDPADPDVLWLSNADNETGRYSLSRLDTEAGVVTRTIALEHQALAIRYASDGRLWIGTKGGVVTVGDADDVRSLPALDGVGVRAFADGADGAVWAATLEHGLVRIRDGRADALGAGRGLPDVLSSVTLDGSGAMWMTSYRTVLRLREDDAVRAFDEPDRPVDAVTLLPSVGHLGASEGVEEVAAAPDGALWMPSSQGVFRIDTRLYAEQFDRPPTVVVDGARGLDGDALAESLPRGVRTIAVAYTATDLLAPSLVRFRTRVGEGGWSAPTADRSVTLGGLDPGDHTVWVQARNGGGVWSEPVAASFSVPPLYVETWWFRALAVLAVLGVVGMAVAARDQRRRQRERRLEQTVADRTEALRIEKERTEAQAEQLRELDRAKSRFFANVSHEFRTPLTLTIGPLEDLRDGADGPLSDAAQESVGLALRSARRVLGLVNQVLDVAKLDAGRVRLRARPTDLGALVGGVADAFAPLAERVGVALEVEAEPVRAWVDAEAMDAVVSNLLSNAFKFTPPGGAVAVTVGSEQGDAVVTVADTGPGIEPADLGRVFERFYQADTPVAEQRQPGTGIGLALARELTALHGGAVSVDSELGRGATFTVRVPLGRGHLADDQVADGLSDADGDAWSRPPDDGAADAPAVSDPDDGADRTTVLVVDDHAGVRAFVRGQLAPDYRVLEAADGVDALEIARERLPDLVVSDVMMPRLDGVGLCRALKSDPATDFIPVVLLTAKVGDDATVEGLGALADAYVTKPFNARALVARVAGLIEGRRRLHARWAAGGDGRAGPEPVGGAADGEALDDGPWLALVRAAVEAGLPDEAFGPDALADAVGLSRSALYRRLSGVADVTPAALLRAARLDRARRLLGEGAGTVGEVAYGVGYRSVSSFSRAYRQRHGEAPSATAARPRAE